MNISASIKGASAAFFMAALLSCSHEDLGGVLRQASPVLSPLSISETTTTSISLDAPVLQKVWNPGGTMTAYIGVSGSIVCTGTDVTGASFAPVDVAASGCTFTGLVLGTTYTIIVVAENELGYWVRSISQSTADCSPKLNNLAVNIGSSSITLVKPSFSLAGNPSPGVKAWIGVKGTISANGSAVSGSIAGPVDAASGDYEFTGLSASEQYTIIVVAENTSGYDIKTISAGITGSAPVMLPIVGSSVGLTSIGLDQPEFSTAGSPSVTVKGWIGTSLVVTGKTVSGTIIESGADVSGGYTFAAGILPYNDYDIVVIAENTVNYDVKTLSVKTPARKEILSYGIPSESAVCTVDNTAHTITGNVPFYHDVDALVASFTLPAATILKVASATQTSGTTVNDFYNSVTTPVVYTAVWADGTTQNYSVTISNYGTVSTPALSISSGADLSAPMGMCTDGTDLYIANTGNHDIVKVTSPGSASPAVSLLAGVKGSAGFSNFALLSSKFNMPSGICFSGMPGVFYVADRGSSKLRSIDVSSDSVSVIGGTLLASPLDVSTDGSKEYMPADNGYVYATSAPVVLNSGNILTGCVGTAYTTGKLYVAADWMLVHMNGVGYDRIAGGSDSSQKGLVDETGTGARFQGISYITADSSGNYLYLSDVTAVRKLNLSTSKVTTIAGSGSNGASDGLGPVAAFSSPQGIAMVGNVLYVLDSTTGSIRKIE